MALLLIPSTMALIWAIGGACMLAMPQRVHRGHLRLAQLSPPELRRRGAAFLVAAVILGAALALTWLANAP